MPVHKGYSPSGHYPYEEILFAVQTKKVMADQGIRFFVRSSVDDDRGTLVNINIPSDMGKCKSHLEETARLLTDFYFLDE